MLKYTENEVQHEKNILGIFGCFKFITNVSRKLPPQNRLHRFSGGVCHISSVSIVVKGTSSSDFIIFTILNCTFASSNTSFSS